MSRDADGAQKRPFGRGRRVGRASTLADLGGRVKRLIAAPRFPALTDRAARVLLVALVEYADGSGKWWPSNETLATKLGVSTRTVQRAAEEFTGESLASLVDPPRPLVTVEPWLRPPGHGAAGPQGSNTYSLDPSLLDDRSVTPCADDRSVTPAGDDNRADPQGTTHAVTPDRRSLNEGRIAVAASNSNGLTENDEEALELWRDEEDRRDPHPPVGEPESESERDVEGPPVFGLVGSQNPMGAPL